MLDVEVAVVGNGPAGAAHAAAHAAAGRSAVLIGTASVHPEGTFELLSGRTEPILRVMGIIDTVCRCGQRCAGTVFRWMRDGFVEQNGQHTQWSGGWIIDRHWFDPATRRAAERQGAMLVEALVSQARPDGPRWALTCTGPGTDPVLLRARRLVLATGRAGRLANRCGLPRTATHRMISIVTRVPVPLPGLGPRLLVDSAEDGWWYAMGDGTRATIGYVTDVDLLRPGPDRLAATWRAAATGADWLPAGHHDLPLRARPSAVAATLVPATSDGPAVTIIGDAALAADPLSGHGLLLGLRGALHAAADPAGYPAWLAALQTSHRRGERDLYRAERSHRTTPFWRRRACEEG